MTPSERISEIWRELRVTTVREARETLKLRGAEMSAEAEACAMLNAYDFAIGRYLNEEAERRARFEAGVVRRLEALEGQAKRTPPPCAAGGRVHDFQGQTACPACGWGPPLYSVEQVVTDAEARLGERLVEALTKPAGYE